MCKFPIIFGFELENILPKINSMTKYPSISTYHIMGGRGRLTSDIIPIPKNEIIFKSEKIDGTNSRIILLPNNSGVLYGSREDLLGYEGDLLYNPANNIVPTIKSPIWKTFNNSDNFIVIFGEVYGGKIQDGAKIYHQELKFRVFDIAIIPNANDVLSMSIEQIAAWREHGGQSFANNEQFKILSETYNVTTVPQLDNDHLENSNDLPKTIEEAYMYLQKSINKTLVSTMEIPGKAEGIIIRNSTRSFIAKLRFEDYQRTLGKKG